MKGTLNFKIRKLAGDRTSIQVIHIFGRGNEIRYSTGLFIKSSNHWDNKKQRVKNIIAQEDSRKINKSLDNLNTLLKDRLSELHFKNPNYTKNDAKRIFKGAFGKSEEKRNPNLLECYKFYFEHFAKNPSPSTQKPLSNGTIKSLKSCYNLLEEYAEKNGGLSYADISLDFYNKFVEFLKNKDYGTNYIGSQIKNLKTILNYSLSNGYHSNMTHLKREFAKPTEEVDSIYLNNEELKQIELLELDNGMDISRDLFLIGAHTGLRVSNFNKLKKENLKNIGGKYYFVVKSTKNNKLLTIPCKPVVVTILKKYSLSPPPKKSDQNINRDLKEIGALAKINEPITIEKTIGGKLQKKTFSKYELIATHTARRSFCTNAYISGMATMDIMTISGHQTERVFYKYIKASNLQRAQKIAEHPFFN
ncbi:MAG: phage integrase SAM-like domain-containing protein [Patiriisocius sp.]|uniref:phage integrase SAM-like domain-containing protein n=1 Tax=Patiriisocius sp. TaxID=2822396 RepID=UPI003EF9C089